MGILRAFFRDHARLAWLVVALALAMKALVPAGYMVGSQGHVLTVEVCADATGGSQVHKIVVPGSEKPASDPGQAKSAPCPWSAHSDSTLATVDAALLAAALAFILVLGFADARLPLRPAPKHVWPPLRGPPVPA